MKKVKLYKIENRQNNGAAKGLTCRMVETSTGVLVPRDPNYPLTAPATLAKSGVTLQLPEKAIDRIPERVVMP